MLQIRPRERQRRVDSKAGGTLAAWRGEYPWSRTLAVVKGCFVHRIPLIGDGATRVRVDLPTYPSSAELTQ